MNDPHPAPSLREDVPLGPSSLLVKAMSEVTRILSAIEQGDPHAAEQLLPLVYDELRKLAAQKLAQEKPGQTLQATALVHEAYLRLVDVEQAQHWNSRGHFFAAAAEAMRRILVDSARRKTGPNTAAAGRRRSTGRGRPLRRRTPPNDLLAARRGPGPTRRPRTRKAAELVKLRYFAGLTRRRGGRRALGISPATADRHWTYARAWLHRQVACAGPTRRPRDSSD